ncbi:hypothetical protein D8674_027357 [Pyrus ussuriensis x Pyrus communis]|uniref:Uncharacterized protein n=1 Tax=Pyrus ussuriensis x Pyrus communis TaxID=2448454 RepID=A0A5N5ICH8_9ROSA|nr:hypothetical protein D8674_027357 [Pyrus ussuriensis x Pyrus communis]
MTSPETLLGPPELYRPNSAIDRRETPTIKTFNQGPQLGQKRSKHSSTFPRFLNPCLKLFFNAGTKINSDTPTPATTPSSYSDYGRHEQGRKDLIHYVERAWNFDPLTTLRLTFTLRMAGKLDKEGFHKSMLWVHENHPLTLSLNVMVFVELGLIKDLLGILYMVLNDSITKENQPLNTVNTVVTNTMGAMAMNKKDAMPYYGYELYDGYYSCEYNGLYYGYDGFYGCGYEGYCGYGYNGRYGYGCNGCYRYGRDAFYGYGYRGYYVYDPYGYYWLGEEECVYEEENRKEIDGIDIQIDSAKIAVERYQNDRDFRNLHDRISGMFTELLISDLVFMEAGEIGKISFASKLCPSIFSKFDRATLLCENIAKRVFPRHSYEEYKYVEEAHYTYSVRYRLHKQVLVPLRKALKSLSVKTTAAVVRKNENAATETKKCSSSPNLEALISMQGYWKILKKERESKIPFELHMKIDAIFGISIGNWLKLPHQVTAYLDKEKGSDEIAELQWRQLVQELSSKGKLRNCIATCDVTGMRGTSKEMECIAMGLLISEPSENPWKGMVFSFSDTPKLHKIEGDNLWSKCELMRQIECAEKLDFLEIYNRVLDIAVPQKLSHDKMPRRIFVFTCRDFNEAFKYDWWDDYKEASSRYRRKGYNLTVPDMVFWNLKGEIAEPEVIYSPVKENHKVGLIISGFSDNLLNMFFNGESDSRTYAAQFQAPYGIDVPDFIPKAEDMMKCVVSREELDNLLVLD